MPSSTLLFGLAAQKLAREPRDDFDGELPCRKGGGYVRRGF